MCAGSELKKSAEHHLKLRNFQHWSFSASDLATVSLPGLVAIWCGEHTVEVLWAFVMNHLKNLDNRVVNKELVETKPSTLLKKL